jgi:hypothetical protein
MAGVLNGEDLEEVGCWLPCGEGEERLVFSKMEKARAARLVD